MKEIASDLLSAIAFSFIMGSGAVVDSNELMCLSENIYHEAKGESIQGKAAVGAVTRNRVNSDKYPDTYCGVVRQGPVYESWKTRRDPSLPDEERVFYPVKHRCQFSWYCDGESDEIKLTDSWGNQIQSEITAWRDSVNISLLIMSGELHDNTRGSLFYYNHNLVYPHWARKFTIQRVIGNHTFMKP